MRGGLDRPRGRSYHGGMAEREDTREDRRGAPPGRWGNVAHKYDPDVAAQAKQLAKLFPVHGEHHIARRPGISRDTPRKHYSREVAAGRAAVPVGDASPVFRL